jgi:hypothetical protein
MNIYAVRDNLKRTIEGKEAYLVQMKQSIVKHNQTVNYAVAKFLEDVNLPELRAILADVEVCCEKATADSWIGVDRQGGI